MAKTKSGGRNRSAITGRYISDTEALQNPKTSVHETDKKQKPTPKKGKK